MTAAKLTTPRRVHFPAMPAVGLLHYGSAIVATSAAVLARVLLTPAIGAQFPFATIYFAVTLVAWYGGLGPALLSTLLGYLGAVYFIIPPHHTFLIHGLANWVGTLIYLFLGLSSALFSDSQRRAQARAETSAQEARAIADALRDSEAIREHHLAEIEALNGRLKLAMAETHHRVKNNLQVITALIDLQTMEGTPQLPREEFLRLSQHVRTLAAIHEILTQDAKAYGDAQTLSVHSLLNRLLDMLQQAHRMGQIHARIADARLSTRQGTALALITNELVSNAIKHGHGSVDCEFTAQGSNLMLEVFDDGPGFPPDFNADKAANTGLELVSGLTRTDLNGQVSYANRPEGGAHVRITFALPTT